MLEAAVVNHLESQSVLAALDERLDGAKIELEHGTFFVFRQLEVGRLMLGWGSTVKKAVDAAIATYEG